MSYRRCVGDILAIVSTSLAVAYLLMLTGWWAGNNSSSSGGGPSEPLILLARQPTTRLHKPETATTESEADLNLPAKATTATTTTVTTPVILEQSQNKDTCDFFNHMTPTTLPRPWRVYQRTVFFERMHENVTVRSVEVVIARCKESLQWIEKFVEYSLPPGVTFRVTVYEKCRFPRHLRDIVLTYKGVPIPFNVSADGALSITEEEEKREEGEGVESKEWDQKYHVTRRILPNVGFNDMAYLTHLAHYVDFRTLADATLLVTADPFAETCDFFNATRKLILAPSPGFYSLGRLYRKIQCDYLSTTEVYKAVLHASCHAWISTYLHSHWFITKPRIMAVDRRVFLRMLDTVNGKHQPLCMYPTQKPQVMPLWEQLRAREMFFGPVHTRVGSVGQLWHNPELIARHRYDAEVVERLWGVIFLEGPRMPIRHGFAAAHAQGLCIKGHEIESNVSAIDLGKIRFCPQCAPNTGPNLKALAAATLDVDDFYRSQGCLRTP